MTQNNLQNMAERSRQLVEQAKLDIPEVRMRSLAFDALEAQLLGQCSDSARPFRHAVAKPGLQLICELKEVRSDAQSQIRCGHLQSHAINVLLAEEVVPPAPKQNTPTLTRERLPEKDATPSFANQISPALRAERLPVEKAARSSIRKYSSLQTIKQLQEQGVAALYCPINPIWSLESLEQLKELSEEIDVPLLAKDLIVDSYQIYEAKAAGASAVLLICGILNDEELVAFNALAENLGMSVLVEVHNENEVKRALSAGARIVGIGNENPCNSSIDFEKLARLRKHIPSGYLCIMNSEAQTPEDLAALNDWGIDASFVTKTLLHTD